MKYDLDPKRARDADDGYSQIPKSGLYVGEIKQAKSVFSKEDTEGIEFTFDCTQGSTTSTLWTMKKSGETTFGYNLVLALMTCLKKRQAIPVEMIVKEYDPKTKKMVEKKGTAFPDLIGEIAIIFQLKEYVKKDGGIGIQCEIKHFFDASTLQTASEILDGSPAVRVHSLKNKYDDIKLPISASLGGAQAYASAPQSYGQPQSQNNYGNGTPPTDINDDEIPF